MNTTSALVALAGIAVIGGVGYMIVKSQQASGASAQKEQIQAAVDAYAKGARRSPEEKILSGGLELVKNIFG